ncbi:hypothetical protein [Cupriavidus pauculus]|nr:hypothetical protein [Cupriavidus pauculus]
MPDKLLPLLPSGVLELVLCIVTLLCYLPCGDRANHTRSNESHHSMKL